jgi:hypothetical protein
METRASRKNAGRRKDLAKRIVATEIVVEEGSLTGKDIKNGQSEDN